MSPIPSPASRPMHILMVEDNARDAGLIVAALRRAGHLVHFERVDVPEALEKELAHDFDVILADHNLQSWTGSDALEILHRSGKDIPVIIVTGSLGDERAVQYLKEGASDYVLKEHLDRLPAAIVRTLQEKAQREENARLQNAIRQSKEDWERTFHAIPDSLLILDRDRRIIRTNRAAEILLGVDPGQLIGRLCSEALTLTLCQELNCPFRSLGESGREQEVEISEPELGKFLRVTMLPLRAADGSLQGAVHVMRDITESRRLQEDLVQAQKLEGIGRLAGGVAHDFNNILAIILGYSQLMKDVIPRLGSPEEARTLLEYSGQIEMAAERGASVTHQLLAFSRKQAMQMKLVEINKLVAETGGMLRSLIGANIELVITLADGLGAVKADPNQIQQVILNLAINARDAMPRGGRLEITTASVELGARVPGIRGPIAPGRYVMLSLADTGVGMNQETLAHVFEPFFTTKERGKGTGFGLSTAYGVVKQSGGHICVASEPGQGATFAIYLPELADQPETMADLLIMREEEKIEGTILLVEDELQLAELARMILEMEGYRVLTAESGEEALRLAAANRDAIDLLLTDIILRGTMDGIELSRRLVQDSPTLRVLFMSGYSDAFVRPPDALEKFTLLEKPFTNDQLRQRVRDAIQRPVPHFDDRAVS